MSHFNALANTWWDVNGPQRILHKMNLLRMDFINETIKAHLPLNFDATSPEEEVYIPCYNLDLLPENVRNAILQEQETKRTAMVKTMRLSALDIGCGGGILTESMGRMPWISHVKGIDLSTEVLAVAKSHKELDPMLSEKVSYELKPVEDIPVEEKYDVVTMFEMLEHVNYPSEVLTQALSRVNPGGWVFISTINRDFVSWFTTIFMGEHVLNVVPVGTHTYDKYINESEIRNWMADTKQGVAQFKVASSKGCVYMPLYGWKFTDSPHVGNYFMAIQRLL
ncbi:hypothetical protein BABINDRAFT_160107 [Babjeviella inositovora NRRL Y-12698]|uniref:Ubiquinone biosynthesis O-methyltransferase, mitochondrial n=1 Tax=Babjeviella inositovora NRRL Y-12698 TaxID=984486 RepID=A0A1E3QXV8_9ASCO|nr:uncharacterized protein BABINDRAFT_160107 [Babjeviella inositovora NRRL Y-12698]ODQ81877.1 hypothetical protein BABINDRAFT_160107 [Babjeviella inositovora NRRL Y-12698]